MSFPTMTQLVRLRAVHIGGQMETEPHLWVWDLEGCSSTRGGVFLHTGLQASFTPLLWRYSCLHPRIHCSLCGFN